jgi:hypothetical protein
MKYPLEDGFLLIRGNNSFLLIGMAKDRFSLCIETSAEEFSLGVMPGDVIVVSAPEGGAVEPALMLMELVRTYRSWYCPGTTRARAGSPGWYRLPRKSVPAVR